MDTPRMRTHLVGKCARSVCRQADCPHAVRLNEYDGRYYITMGHAAFNSPANNRNGYKTEASAKAAITRCLNAQAKANEALEDFNYVGSRHHY